VLHLALRARSVDADNHYTTPGLGDRIHSCILAWCIGRAHNSPITIHLTHNKSIGGQFGNKPQSWQEIKGLFPKGSLEIVQHKVSPTTESGWIDYLTGQGYKPLTYHYADYRGSWEEPSGLDASHYLKTIPLLTPKAQPIKLPDKFITTQWDSNGPARQVDWKNRNRALQKYQDEGYTPVIVGGQAKSELMQWSLASIGYVMSKASFHVGVDSGFMHLAQLYMPYERIHVYSEPETRFSRHLKRAIDNGSPLNFMN